MGYYRMSEFKWNNEEYGPQRGKRTIKITVNKQAPEEVEILSIQKNFQFSSFSKTLLLSTAFFVNKYNSYS